MSENSKWLVYNFVQTVNLLINSDLYWTKKPCSFKSFGILIKWQ